MEANPQATVESLAALPRVQRFQIAWNRRTTPGLNCRRAVSWFAWGQQFNTRSVLTFDAMAVDPKLLNLLACPVCKTPVSLTSEGQGLKCEQCHRVYPIRDDIPVMLEDEARPLGPEEA